MKSLPGRSAEKGPDRGSRGLSAGVRGGEVPMQRGPVASPSVITGEPSVAVLGL